MMVPNLRKKKCDRCRHEYQPTNGRQKLCTACSTRGKGRKKNKKPTGLWIEGQVSDAITMRVNHLGMLHDRHKDLLDAKDKAGLLQLADDYMNLKHPCTVMARAIRMQAESIQ